MALQKPRFFGLVIALFLNSITASATQLEDCLDQTHDITHVLSTLDKRANCATVTQEAIDPCKLIYDLSAAMNKNVRDIPLESLMSLLALGAGRTGDFIKYLAEQKDSALATYQHEEKTLNRSIESNHEKLKKAKKILKNLRAEIRASGTADPTALKFLENAESEFEALENEKTSLAEALKKAESESEAIRIRKNKISLPYWPLKLAQIAFGSVILGQEIMLCEKKSASCVLEQIAEVLNPIPISEVGDGTLTARYESIPALLILDVERKKLSRDDACYFVLHDRKLLQDFALVRTLMSEMAKQ